MRFTLPKLFLAVTLAALACGGMMARTRGWAVSIVTLSVAMFAIVSLMAIASTGQSRIFRAASAATGAVYLIIVMSDLFTPLRDSLLTHRALILAANAIQVPVQAMQPPIPIYSAPAVVTPSTGSGNVAQPGYAPAPTPTPAAPTASGGTLTGTLTLSAANTYTSIAPAYTYPRPYLQYDPMDYVFGSSSQSFNYAIPAVSFLVIGHCAWAWLLALVAGWFASTMYAKYQRSVASAQPQGSAA